MKLFSRRSLLVAMPAVILTPKLLMPVITMPSFPEGGDWRFHWEDGQIWECIVAGTPGTWKKVATWELA